MENIWIQLIRLCVSRCVKLGIRRKWFSRTLVAIWEGIKKWWKGERKALRETLVSNLITAIVYGR